MPIFVAAASNAMAGNLDVAANAMQRLRELDPNFRVHKSRTAFGTDNPRYSHGGKMPYVGRDYRNDRRLFSIKRSS